MLFFGLFVFCYLLHFFFIFVLLLDWDKPCQQKCRFPIDHSVNSIVGFDRCLQGLSTLKVFDFDFVFLIVSVWSMVYAKFVLKTVSRGSPVSLSFAVIQENSNHATSL